MKINNPNNNITIDQMRDFIMGFKATPENLNKYYEILGEFGYVRYELIMGDVIEDFIFNFPQSKINILYIKLTQAIK
jgi:hypothetical protein